MLTALALTACAPGASHDNSGVTVAAGAYPLAFIAERVVGDHGQVLPLAAPGVEPHDVELSPATVRQLNSADLVLFVAGFQPAVDDAIATAGLPSLDAQTVVNMREYAHDDDDDHDDHDDHDHDDHGHDHTGLDPHFWLDPQLMADYAQAVAASLGQIDEANKDSYAANAAAVAAELQGLDGKFASGLAQCVRREVVVAHEAFGYLANAYDLEQISVAGIDSDSEPSPARLRETSALIQAHGVTTVFTQSAHGGSALTSLAADAKVQVQVLDPVETVVGNDNYLAVMERNLNALMEGLSCG